MFIPLQFSISFSFSIGHVGWCSSYIILDMIFFFLSFFLKFYLYFSFLFEYQTNYFTEFICSLFFHLHTFFIAIQFLKSETIHVYHCPQKIVLIHFYHLLSPFLVSFISGTCLFASNNRMCFQDIFHQSDLSKHEPYHFFRMLVACYSKHTIIKNIYFSSIFLCKTFLSFTF